MSSRLELHELFCEILGSRNVYYSPPPSVRMNYPAIVYSLSDMRDLHADDSVYGTSNVYEATVIVSDPDSEIPAKVKKIRSSRLVRAPYVSDNLYHHVFRLYY